jgi:aspartate/glutamate racemase
MGILVLDEAIPRVPGSVGNAKTFSFPVRYKKILGATVGRLLGKHDTSMAPFFVEAARELQAEGVGAIAGSCGFMALFQQEVAEALEIPVFLSSLLQVPLMTRILGPHKKIGVITANAHALTPDVLKKVGVTAIMPLIIRGLEKYPEAFSSLIEEKGSLDEDKMREEVLNVARAIMKEHQEIGGFLLECSELPPYSKAVQDATGLPVFDFVTLIYYIQTALSARTFV